MTLARLPTDRPPPASVSMAAGKHVVLMLYWSTCPHCEELQPHFERAAAKAEAAFDNAPSGAAEIVFGR
eukprot:SAG11_NODE_18391_length_492_cov_1.167939_1_plen_68_part_10